MCWLHKLRTKYWNFQYIISYLREERTWGNSPFKNSHTAIDTLSHLPWRPKPKWETLKDRLRDFLEKKSHRPCFFTSCLYQKHTMVSKPECATSFSWVGNDSFTGRIYSFKSSDMGNSCNELIYNYLSKFSSLFPLGKIGLSTFQIWCHIISHMWRVYTSCWLWDGVLTVRNLQYERELGQQVQQALKEWANACSTLMDSFQIILSYKQSSALGELGAEGLLGFRESKQSVKFPLWKGQSTREQCC